MKSLRWKKEPSRTPEAWKMVARKPKTHGPDLPDRCVSSEERRMGNSWHRCLSRVTAKEI
jgi:hypothetical protein